MDPNPTTQLAEAFASLRRAVIAQAQTSAKPNALIGSISLALILALIDALIALASTYTPHKTTRTPGEALRRTQDRRRERLAERGSLGRRRFATWWSRNRGPHAIPGTHQIPASPKHPRAPPPPNRPAALRHCHAAPPP